MSFSSKKAALRGLFFRAGTSALRRRLVFALAATLVANPGFPQPAARPPRIGFLTGEPPGLGLEPFKQGLREYGYVDGQNVALEIRQASSRSTSGDLVKLAEDLVRAKVDVIVAGGSDSIRAAQRATKNIPIVMAQTSDALGSGFVSSLARPGGNITGVSSLTAEMGAKRLQLATQIVKPARRVAVLSIRGNPSHPPQVRILQAAAKTLGVELDVVEAGGREDLPSAFSKIAKPGTDALLVLPDTAVHPKTEILQLSNQNKLPVVWWRREFVEAGGLISYGPDNPGMYRQAAGYVHRILKGAKPAELPVEQPSKFEVFVNLRTASALGVTIPQSILLAADRVIR